MNWLRKLFVKTPKVPSVPEEISDEMKYLIVGLGNIGPEYEYTRHNIGFEVVDALAKEFEVNFKTEKLGDVAAFRHKGRSFTLLKPSTYMNLSGKAVNFWMQKNKIQRENLLVIVDDLNLPFGKLRLKGKGSDGGHNGLKDINQYISSKYARLRFGIGDEFSKGSQVNFVLGRWSESEEEKLNELIGTSKEIIKSFGTIGLDRTMNTYN